MIKIAASGSVLIALTIGLAQAATQSKPNGLQGQLTKLVSGFSGRVGISIQDGPSLATIKPASSFPLQSVMKLVVAAAVLDSVDRGKLRLNDRILVTRSNLSVYVEPIASLVTTKGYQTTLSDLIHRAIVDSDNAAADILFKKSGGANAISSFLKAHKIRGISVDRNEKQLQSEIRGLKWQQKYIDPALFDKAVASVPKAQRDAAWKAYLTDSRDTASPVGMGAFLQALLEGRLLSKDATKFLIGVMQETKTGSDRLKAGLSPGWALAHKTGSSGAWSGMTAATNDVGILMAPDGAQIPIVVFVADSTASDAQRAALIADVARAAIENHVKR